MKQTITCTILSHPKQYHITVESGLLSQENLYHCLHSLANRFVIITDDHVKEKIGTTLFEKISSSGLKVDLFSFPPGEENKNRATKEVLENKMFETTCGRDTCLIALGGGVATDLGGFIASTYCRGIPLVMIPTSLLAMIDASIGGKNGVDVPYGKNLIGNFYQPEHVMVDPLVLKTLPGKELRNGVVEMIKHALIADTDHFKFLQKNASRMISLESSVLEEAIFVSCQIKKRIVEEDEKESGKRRLLNFGHTIAHAIEHLTNYTVAHGEAVAIGIMIESYLSNQMGHLSNQELEMIHQTFLSYGVPLRKLSELTPQQIIEATTLDKKSVKGESRYILLEKIGVPLDFDGEYCTFVEESALIQALEWYTELSHGDGHE